MFRLACNIGLITMLLLAGCRNETTHLFTKLDHGKTNINFKNTIFEDGPLNVANYIYFYNGGGVAIGDINNDGLQDILFTGNMVKNRLYLNKGNFEFEDITAKSGVAEKQGWCTGATMADINGDGKLDIYICRSADIDPDLRKNLLFINNGDLTFSEKAAEYGLDESGYSTQAGFFDYDKDGDLDCFIINHSIQKYTQGIQDEGSLRKERNPDFASKLYRNDNGHYSDVSVASGIVSNVFTFGLGLAITDVNNDGWPDIYVSNDFNEPDYLFINNRNGTYRETLADCMDEVSLFSMGSDAADFNNDGLIDIATFDMLAEDNKTQKMHSGAENFDKFQFLFRQGFYYQYSRNMLQKNNGDGTFSEVGQLAKVSNTDWSWTALFSDYDNDGNKDLFVTNGYVKDYTDMDFLKYSVDRVIRTMHKDSADGITEYIRKMPTHVIPNYIFRNNGDETFTKKTTEWGLGDPGISAGAAYADLDNDGDMDLVLSNTNDFAGIYRNNSEQLLKNNYIRIKLQGDAKNERGIGARVSVYCKGKQYYQEQMPVRGFQSSVDPVLSFGIGINTVADSIVIIWPGNQLQRLKTVKPNQTIMVRQVEAREIWKVDSTATAEKLFQPSSGLKAVHQENVFNDFTVQTLLLNYLSRQGPCMAKADINGDGKEDVYIGGAKGESGKIFLQSAGNNFVEKAEPGIEADALSEDVAATFFDADQDGDTDLYVASGGYEFTENNPAFQDRLYLNDGKGNFIKKKDALPGMLSSKGCVKTADIDADGDQDIFVGGRVVPGKYPETPRSMILQNDGKGNFTDVTATLAPVIQEVGMVTDAVWLDLNKDAYPDLIVVGEWMPVRVFINQQGKLTDASAAYIKFASTGWWNHILAEDFDGDGDQDLVIGNLGMNAQFRASEKEPVSLYYNDFDHNGSVDPVFCYYIDGVSYPAASRDDLMDQLPGLKKKFLEYHTYADAKITDVFTPDQLKEAHLFQAQLLQTVYLENNGSNGFTLKALPIEAQYAPVYAVVALDANHDGKMDMVLGGNNSWTRIKFGRYNANHGILLLGDGKGNFTYVPQWKSGFNIRGNVRSMVAVNTGKEVKLIVGINDAPVIMLKMR